MFSRPKIAVEDFEAQAMPHLASLFRSAFLLTRDRSVAEDLVQEAYLEAWKSFHRFEAGTNCKAWLFKIMFNRLHHHRRRLNRLSELQEPLVDDDFRAEPPVPQEIQDEEILGALEKIPVEFREAVLMADVEDFSYREIAETLRVPLGTVMSRLSRGRRLLREELAGVASQYGI
ncbi:MAG: sigma-70 family RNA polymerase sigma factor, partial [Deltaproteobacteria bacterium]